MRLILLIAVVILYAIHDLAHALGALAGGTVIVVGLLSIRACLLPRQGTLDSFGLVVLNSLNHLHRHLLGDKANDQYSD
jgi:hypothetical protein